MTGKHKHDRKEAEDPVSSPPPAASAPAEGKTEARPSRKVEIEQAELDRLRAQELLAEEYKDKYLRALADGENFRKRLEKDKKEFLEFAIQDLITELLPVLDNFERALSAAPPGVPDPFRRGVEMIYKQLMDALAKEGLKQIEARGGPFDPFVHEAVAEEPTSAVPDGSIVSELQKGYQLKSRLLRPAAVRVARAPVPPQPETKP